MTDKTFDILYQRLLNEIANHPHREEILKLASEQLADDSTFVRHTIPS